LLDMGKTVTVSSVRLSLGGEPGAVVQVRVGDIAVLADMFMVSSAADVGGTVRLSTQVRASGRYVLIWFTELPPIGHGEYQVSVSNATVDGIVGS
jgi:eukaryotic-like serine/threonine-protein kinase